MNWIAFAVAAWVCLGLDRGLAPLLSPGMGRIAPSFVVPLVVFVALNAPPRAALWAALALGLATDLTSPVEPAVAGVPVWVPGPNALGMMLAAQLVLAMRGMVLKRRLPTMIVLSVLAAAVSSVVVVAIFSVRGFAPEAAAVRPAAELLRRLGSALYTAGSAAVLGLVLEIRVRGLAKIEEALGGVEGGGGTDAEQTGQAQQGELGGCAGRKCGRRHHP